MGAIQGRGKGGGGGGGRGGLLDAIQGTSMRDNNNKSRLSLLNLTILFLYLGGRGRGGLLGAIEARGRGGGDKGGGGGRGGLMAAIQARNGGGGD